MRSFITGTFTAALLLSLVMAMPGSVRAGTASSVLESAVARYLLLETAEGTQFLGRLSGHAVLGCGTACREEALKKLKSVNPQMEQILNVILSDEALKEMTDPSAGLTAPVLNRDELRVIAQL